MYKLVIAEKPSVAVYCKSNWSNKSSGRLSWKETDIWSAGVWDIWWAYAEPEFYDEKYGKWRYEDLPILPKQWEYQVSEATRKQFKILKDLMRSSDVESLIEATDLGREGELIFRLVYHQAGCRSRLSDFGFLPWKTRRLKEGFANLKPGTEYDALYEVAICRERADWIVGMNATRLFSTLYGQTLNVGRVMTPTLAMLVTREAEISGFKPEPFYTIGITVGGVKATGKRIMDKNEAMEVLQKVKDAEKAVIRKNRTTEKQEKAPQLYDLTNLQREANKLMGFTAQQTLDYAQSLYEKKLITYPRTDSRFLTEDMEVNLPELSKKMADKFGYHGALPMNCRQVINNKKVTDHHAIIPTVNVHDVAFGELPSGEQKILSMVVARLLAGIGEPHVIAETELEFDCAGYPFKAKAKQVVKNGWKDVVEWILGGKKKG